MIETSETGWSKEQRRSRRFAPAFSAVKAARRLRKMEMATGIVKWFNDAKGFGFIKQEGGEDVFCHHTAIVADGFRSLTEGQTVEFEVKRGPKGLQAENVRIVR
jgi:cold shock protein